MSRNTNPNILEKERESEWQSEGFYHGNEPQYLKEDYLIREYVKDELEEGRIELIKIKRSKTTLKVDIRTGRPALVIGRGGKRIKEIKSGIEEILAEQRDEDVKKINIDVEVIPVKEVWSSAKLASDWMSHQLEKRVPYRRVLKMALDKIMDADDVEGARVMISGRLNGLLFARSEWLEEGNLPRQEIRAKMDYGFDEANCSYGTLGVKVWIYKGKEFDTE